MPTKPNDRLQRAVDTLTKVANDLGANRTSPNSPDLMRRVENLFFSNSMPGYRCKRRKPQRRFEAFHNHPFGKTTTEIVECEGRDLPSVLSRLRTEGAFVWRMDCVRVSAWKLHIKRPPVVVNIRAAK